MEAKEALIILATIKAAMGRTYKYRIRQAWMTGDYTGVGLGQWSAELQNIRNSFGPSWLADV